MPMFNFLTCDLSSLIVANIPYLYLLQILSVMIFVSMDKNIMGYTALVCSLAVGETAAYGFVVGCVQAREAVLAHCASSLPARDLKPLH